jgi:hypothetical protein
MSHYNSEDKNQHFYVMCAMGWATDENLFVAYTKLASAYKKSFAKGKFYVAAYHLPVPADTPYQINYYIPRDPSDEEKPFPDMTKIFEGFVP